MKKQEFICALREKLSNFPRKDIDERILFYEEMIDDRIEEGMSEEEAVANIGSVDDVYAQMLRDVPLIKIIKNKVKPKKCMSGGKIALICSTSIIWLPLLLSAFAVLLSLYAVLWSLVASVWAMFISFGLSAPVVIIIGIISTFSANVPYGIALIGMSLVLAGLTVFAFYGSSYSTKGAIALTKKCVIGIKNIIVK